MSGERGFTLIETLIAFAILAVTLVSLYEALGTGLRGFTAASRVEEAVMIARSELDRIVALQRLPLAQQGRSASNDFEWKYEVLSKPTSPQASALRPVTIRLWVMWTGNAGTQKISIDRLIFVRAQDAER
jgi:general secretion pathway protein I